MVTFRAATAFMPATASDPMSVKAGLDGPGSEDVRRKRLLFRSWHRGTQESDLLLGSFADKSIPDFDHAQLGRLEALLDCADPELFDWMMGRSAPPAAHDHDVMQLLRSFCAQPTQASSNANSQP